MPQKITAAHAMDKKQVWFAARAAYDQKGKKEKNEQFLVEDFDFKPPKNFLLTVQSESLTVDAEKASGKLKVTLQGVSNEGKASSSVLGFIKFK